MLDPNMLVATKGHSSISLINKIFMIGGQSYTKLYSCEAFDSFTKKFTFVKLNCYFYKNISPKQIPNYSSMTILI